MQKTEEQLQKSSKNNLYTIPCVIFAGGKSSRMGEDKALLPFGNYSTLTEYQYHKLKNIFKDVYVSCKDKHKFEFNAHFIEDLQYENTFAPTIGFLSSFNTLENRSFFAISVDTPFISSKTIEAIVTNDSNDFDATVAIYNQKIQPMCGIYHSSLLQKFEKMLRSSEHKLNQLLKESNTQYIESSDDIEFINLNYKEDYQRALELLK